MVKDEAASVLTFRDRMKQRVKGQDAALEILDIGIQAAKAGLNNPDAPIGVFLLVGPSGVGKTETALALADLLFGGDRFLTTINMSEFMESHSVARLIGAPPGYKGYGEGGRLTEAVRQKPYSVVLLDEVEKAHNEVLNIFDELTEAIRPALSKYFQPALLARMSIVPYLPVHGDAMKEIVRLKLDKVGRRLLNGQKIALNYSSDVIAQIERRCTETETGARNIDLIINRELLPRMSTRVLEMLANGETAAELRIGLDSGGQFEFAFAGTAAPA
jgi:type VI secretion system protein VasG